MTDKDPILEQKFFDFLFPLAYPEIDSSSDIYEFCKNKLSINDALLPAGSLLEKAISIRKGITRHPTVGRDFVDGSDAKSASCRWYSNNKSYGAPIHETFNKRGLLRCVIYERLQDKFYFFLIPRVAYEHIPKSSNIEIPFNLDGSPRRDAPGVRNVDWWQFEVKEFDNILADIAPSFEFAKDKKIRLSLEKAFMMEPNSSKAFLPKKHSTRKPRTDPTVQSTTLCTVMLFQQQSLDFLDTQSTSLSD